MIKNLLLALLVIVAIVGITFGTAQWLKTSEGDFILLEKGQSIGHFTFTSMDGETYDSDDYADRHVVLHFWATWCPPCVVEFSDIVQAASDNPNVTFFAISSDRTREAIDRFMTQHVPALPDNFIMVHDADRSITNGQFSVFQLPESMILKPGLIFDTHIKGAFEDWETMNF